MRTTVTIVHVSDTDTDDVWIDVTNDEGLPVSVVEALGICEQGKALLLEQG